MAKKLLVGVLVLAALLTVVAGGVYRWFNPPAPPAQLFVNGTVMTMDPSRPRASAMLVRRDTIVALGDEATLRRQVSHDVRVIDLKGGVLMPGFIEAHGHFPGEGLAAVAVDANSPPIGDLYGIKDLLERLKMLAQKRPQGWLLAYGFDDTRVGEQRFPTRQELDTVSRDQPILVTHISGHLGVVNSAALTLLGLDDNSQDPPGGYYGRDADGHLNGLLAESAFAPVREQALALSAMDGLKVLNKASQLYLSRGITFAQNGLATPTMLRHLRPALNIGMLPLRLDIWPDAEAEHQLESGALSLPWSKKVIKGPVKLVSDGSIQGYTAFLSQPYYRLPPEYPPGYVGFPAMDTSALAAQVTEFHCKGRRVAVHANGDAAIAMTLDAVAAARRACPQIKADTVLVHAQMATPAQLDRMVALEVTPTFFNTHVYYWGDRHRDLFLGPQRAARISPLAQAQKRGLRFTLHADSPVVPFLPLQLVWNAVYRRTSGGELLGPQEAIGVQRALQAVTIDAARQLGVDGWTGSLVPGKKADLVWLDRDPREFLQGWQSIQVLGTWVNGVLRYPQGQEAR
ncbi:hypothetical protein A11A3_11858 [Alcanivorax hongdengensis A-11-3]|uniref:Amidohydrolase 3 domain-containing protein n=1 Tax=Alcanivorax hongdengensis A-11-3 TaxID=1177179 RepID=L0W9U8_9GAMM|nr:amidohydrolase [Alcanivorax hongdengensis]EKF73774.1 hypothetical protein A11A3_11858 [Alcanivorax hongdengensis A-11-3]